MILVYKGKTWTCDVAKGDVVVVTGASASYAKAVQFGATCEYEKVGKAEFKDGEAQVLDAALIDAMGDEEVAVIKLVKVKGTLQVSGNYFNVNFEGSKYTGSVTYPADAEGLKAYDGKEVEITGYYTGISGSNYFSILYTEIKVAGDEPEVKLPENVELISCSKANELGVALESGALTDKEYAVKGVIKNITNTMYGNMYIEDETGEFLVYGLFTVDGVRFDAMTSQPKVGDTIVAYGKITNYNGTAEIKNATLANSSSSEEPGDEPEVPADAVKVEAVLNGNVGDTYKVQGTVAAVNAQSFILSDETGMILVYKGKTWTCDVAKGDVVVVTGASASYAKAVQFGATCEYEKVGKAEFKDGEAQVLDAALIDAMGDEEVAVIKLVKVKGTLQVSGNYFNVNFEGSKYTGSVTYPADAEGLKAYDGKEVEITGYYTGISGTRYFNILYTEIKVAGEEPGDEPAVESEVYYAYFTHPMTGVQIEFTLEFNGDGTGYYNFMMGVYTGAFSYEENALSNFVADYGAAVEFTAIYAEGVYYATIVFTDVEQSVTVEFSKDAKPAVESEVYYA